MKKLFQIFLAVFISSSAFCQSNASDFYKKIKQLTQGKKLEEAAKVTSVCVKDSMIMRNWAVGTNSWVNSQRQTYGYTPSLDLGVNVFSSWGGNMWYLNGKMTMTYDNKHHLLSSLLQYISGSTTLSNNNLVTKTYDTQGNLLLELYQNWNSASSAWVNYSKYSYTYDAANNQLTYLEQTWNTASNSWKDDSKYINTYSGNNLISETSQIYSTAISALVNDEKYTYSYDIFNKVIGGMAYSWNSTNSTWENSELLTVTYSGNNMTLVLDQAWNSFTNSWVNNYRSSYTYDANHNQTSEFDEEFDISTNTWKAQYKHLMTYDNFNNQLTMTGQIWTTGTTALINDERYTYTYDANHNQVSSLFETWNNSTNSWINNNLSNSFYNCKTAGISEVTGSNNKFALYPNPAQSELFIESEIEYSALQILNISGQIVFSTQGNGKSFSVVNLEKGIYFIQLLGKTENIVRTEKFIKE